MTSIARELVAATELIGKELRIPPIRDFHIAPGGADATNNSNFAFVVLDDDTVGLTYVAMDNVRNAIVAAVEKHQYSGTSPLDMARLYIGESAWQRALGLAAVNAVSQLALRGGGRRLPEVSHTIDLLELEPSDHVGMVGYFPPLVEQICARGLPLTVIELDEKWLGHGENLEVTLDPTRLALCNKVLCTGTTLVNHTLDSILLHAAAAERFCLIGPTASCLAKPLFERGVTMLCGCQVTDCERFIELWSNGQRWREATRRYMLSAAQDQIRRY